MIANLKRSVTLHIQRNSLAVNINHLTTLAAKPIQKNVMPYILLNLMSLTERRPCCLGSTSPPYTILHTCRSLTTLILTNQGAAIISGTSQRRLIIISRVFMLLLLLPKQKDFSFFHLYKQKEMVQTD